MKKIILIAALALTGCATPLKITTQTIPQAVPIIYSPAPPVVVRPALPTDSITPQTSDGDVAKDYAATVQALLGYSTQLEDIIAQYKNIHDAYATLQSQIAADWKAKTGTDLVIPPQTTAITVPKQ